MKIDEEKTECNRKAKASMREYLLSKSWPEKVRSIERMNRARKSARKAMAEAMAKRDTANGTLCD